MVPRRGIPNPLDLGVFFEPLIPRSSVSPPLKGSGAFPGYATLASYENI